MAGGYAWWYLDALSADGRDALTLIAFVGSVFSPYYAHARRRGLADPLDHCALNVALYGTQGRGWAMTERPRRRVLREARHWDIGPSALDWDGEALTIRIDERCAPLPTRLRGTVRVRPQVWPGRAWLLDDAGRHRWRPLAPRADVEVELEEPAMRWRGTGYLDSNEGDEPLERAFVRWDWSRAALGDEAVVLYEVERRAGGPLALALRFDAAGEVEPVELPPPVALRGTRWRVARATRADEGRARVVETLEDGPFYARSLLSTRLLGAPATAVHESLSLARFAKPWVQMLLPFRMPRW